jgi:DNA uptake protein ComE-like DNA-binding protein
VHDANLSVRVEFADARVLFTGDAEAVTETRYVDSVAELLDAQLYQVGHHGSRTSTSQALLDAATPDHAVYSAGADNQFGHSHAEVLNRLDDAGVDVWGTDVNETVTATIDGSPDWTVTPETAGTPQPGDPDDEPAGCVDINREDDLDELQRILHIGEQRAHDLIDHRPYDTLDDLQRIDGIGPSRVEDMKDQGLAAVEC